jgi:di/tripeptidase
MPWLTFTVRDMLKQRLRNDAPIELLVAFDGGTDGSLLTLLGLPTPNLSTGEHNPHSPLEWTCLEEMETAVDVLVKLAALWGRESLAAAGQGGG